MLMEKRLKLLYNWRRIQLLSVASAIGHVGLRTCIQDWTCVRILTGPGHWTKAELIGEKLHQFIQSLRMELSAK